MENKKNTEELIQETEIIEEEALKADTQRRKKLVKKILIGTGIAALIGGVIAAVKSNSKDCGPVDGFEFNPDQIPEETKEETTEVTEEN